MSVFSIVGLQTEWSRLSHSSLVRNAGWMFAGEGLSLVCQASYFILIARLLGSAEYGRYVGAVAMASILSQYTSLGSREVLFRYVSPDRSKFAFYWGNVLVNTLIFGSLWVVLITVAGPHIAPTYSRTMLLCVALADCLFAQLTIGVSRVFQAFEMMRMSAGFTVMINLLRALLAGLMLFFFRTGNAQQWSIASLIVAVVVSCVALLLLTRSLGRPRFSPGLLLQRTGEGLVFTLSYSTDGIYNNIDKAMLGHYGMNAANGIYAMAYRVIDVCTAPITSVHAAAFPRFFSKGVDGVRSTGQYARQILRRTAPLAVLCIAGMLLVAPVIPHLLGKGFSDSVPALRWLCLLPFLRSLHLSAGDAITGAGHQKIRLVCQAAAAGFNFCVNLYLIPRYSWHGAAWSSLATDGLLAALNWIILLWLMSTQISQERALLQQEN